jgi:hypothetical protein
LFSAAAANQHYLHKGDRPLTAESISDFGVCLFLNQKTIRLLAILQIKEECIDLVSLCIAGM